ncbi:MAG: hypothetical protein ACI4UJ_05165 [Candidatus Cryptobacteroides sp.]
MFRIKSLLFAAVSMLFVAASCSDVPTEMDKDYNQDYDINYELRAVLEKDPVNINGIDVYPYFDFFKTLKFTIKVREGRMSSLIFDNGDVPFSPFKFSVPSGEVSCEFDDSVSPNVLRLKDSKEVIATYRNGELYIPFVLDCEELTYEFRFKEVIQ